MGLYHLLEKTSQAWGLSGQIGAQAGASRLAVFSDMAYCWVRSSINPASYALYGFGHKSRSEKAEYLSKRQLDALQAKLNPPPYVALADDKLRFFERCRKMAIPTPEVLGVVPAGETYLPEGVPTLRSARELGELLGALGSSAILFKPIDGGHGQGVLILERRQGELRDKRGRAWSAEELFGYCQRGVDSYGRQSRGFLIQPCLAPDARLHGIMPGPALGTIRLMTLLRRDGATDIIYTFGKATRRGNLIDNFHHGRTGNLMMAIDIESGLCDDAWAANSHGPGLVRCEVHPDTGVAFRSVRIPRWPEVLDVCRRAAQAFSELKTVGWDVAITPEGVTVIEANWHYDPDGLQIVLGRGIKSEILRHFARAAGPAQ